MIIRDVNLETVCGVTSKLPENTLPEFAFAGKSNVGDVYKRQGYGCGTSISKTLKIG